MEFMRAAAKVIMNHFAKLYEDEKITRITITTKKQQGSYQVTDEGGFFKMFTYMTGEISWCYGSSIFKTHCDYTPYYIYNENDDHSAVLKQLEKDLRQLSKHLSDIFVCSFDCGQYENLITFEYGKPVSFNIKQWLFKTNTIDIKLMVIII